MKSWLLGALVVGLVGCGDRTRESTEYSHEEVLPEHEPVNLPVTMDVGSDATTVSTPSLAGAVGPQSHYMVMFGYQGRGSVNLPRNSHTYTMLVRAIGEDLTTAALETHVISWLPEDGLVGVGQPVKKGKNYSYDETVAVARRSDFEVRRSYVVRIAPILYRRGLARFDDLVDGAASERIRYKMIDDLSGRQRVLDGEDGYTNCIHAVSDASIQGSMLQTGTRRGFAASDAVYEYLKVFVREPDRHYDDPLAARLGL